MKPFQSALAAPKLGSLARALVRAGRVSETQAQAATLAIATTPGRLPGALIAMKVLTADELAEFIMRELGFPQVDLSALDTARLPPRALPPAWASIACVLSETQHSLTVAVADPTDTEWIEALHQATGLAVECVVADLESLSRRNRLAG
jgi:type IV pilus assembly protein PilB